MTLLTPFNKNQIEQVGDKNPLPPRLEELEEIAKIKPSVISEAKPSQYEQEAWPIILPSEGLFYEGEYHNMKQLMVRKLNWMDEDILATPAFYYDESVILRLLKNTVVDMNGFNPEDLLPVDKDAIIIWLRIGAFGPEYTTYWKSPYPNEKNEFATKPQKIIWNLSEIEFPIINKTYYEEIKQNGYVTTKTPNGMEWKLSLASIGKEHMIKTYLLDYYKGIGQENKKPEEFIVTANLLAIIKEAPNGATTIEDIHNFLIDNKDKVGFADSRKLRQVAQTINIQLDVTQEVVCKHSKVVTRRMPMPMNINFFWPEFDSIQGVSTQER